jgi:hypothetical protein
MNKFLALILAVTLSSCLSSRARDEGLLPAARMAWGDSTSGVRSDIERGVIDAVEDGDLADPAPMIEYIEVLEKGLKNGDRVTLTQAPWALLHPYGARGIQDRVDDGEVSPMIATGSLLQRLDNFGYALVKLQELYVNLPMPDRREHWLPNGGGRTTPEYAVIAAGAR